MNQYVSAPFAPAASPVHRDSGSNTLLGTFGIVMAVLSGAALAIAALNLSQATDFVAAGAGRLPESMRASGLDGCLGRAGLFGLLAMLVAALGTVFGLIGRRSGAGKAAIVASSLSILAGFGIQARAYTHPTVEADPPAAAQPEDTPTVPEAVSAAPASKDGAWTLKASGPRHESFRLGNDLGTAMLARANGANADAYLARAKSAATAVGAKLPDPPVLSGDSTTDSADALFYLKTSGKTIWTDINARHGEGAASLFELGMKLEILRMLHNDPEMATGLVRSLRGLAKKANLAPEATARLDAVQPESDASSPAIDDTIKAIDAALAKEAPAPAPKVAAKRAPAPKPAAPGASTVRPGNAGRISDADRYQVTFR